MSDKVLYWDDFKRGWFNEEESMQVGFEWLGQNMHMIDLDVRDRLRRAIKFGLRIEFNIDAAEEADVEGNFTRALNYHRMNITDMELKLKKYKERFRIG